MSGTWPLELTPTVLKQLKKLGKPVAQRVLKESES